MAENCTHTHTNTHTPPPHLYLLFFSFPSFNLTVNPIQHRHALILNGRAWTIGQATPQGRESYIVIRWGHGQQRKCELVSNPLHPLQHIYKQLPTTATTTTTTRCACVNSKVRIFCCCTVLRVAYLFHFTTLISYHKRLLCVSTQLLKGAGRWLTMMGGRGLERRCVEWFRVAPSIATHRQLHLSANSTHPPPTPTHLIYLNYSLKQTPCITLSPAHDILNQPPLMFGTHTD